MSKKTHFILAFAVVTLMTACNKAETPSVVTGSSVNPETEALPVNPETSDSDTYAETEKAPVEVQVETTGDVDKDIEAIEKELDSLNLEEDFPDVSVEDLGAE